MVIGPGISKKKCSAEGCTNKLSMKECVGGSSGAAAKDSTIMLSKEECASGMGQVAYYAAVGCTSRCLNSAVCVKHGAHKTKLCSSEWCTHRSKKGGVCIRHGAQVKICIWRMYKQSSVWKSVLSTWASRKSQTMQQRRVYKLWHQWRSVRQTQGKEERNDVVLEDAATVSSAEVCA